MQIAKPTILNRHGNPIRHVEQMDEADVAMGRPANEADRTLAKEVGLLLHKHYPGHLWGVLANHKQGIVQIMIPCLTQMSYVIHTKNVFTHNDLVQKVIHAGGSFLECYRIPRSGFSETHFIDAWKANPIGWRQQVNPETL